MLDIEHEELITLAQAAKLIPRNGGKKTHVTTIWRWAKYGMRGVRLEAVRSGRTWFTSAKSVQRFLSRLANLDRPDGARLEELARRREELRRLNARAEAALKGIGLA